MQPRDPFSPGDRISAEWASELTRSVANLYQTPGFDAGSSGIVPLPQKSDTLFIALTTIDSSGTVPKYSWNEVYKDTDGSVVDRPNGAMGDSNADPAYHVANLTLPVNDHQAYLARRDGSGKLVFTSGGSGGASQDIVTGVCVGPPQNSLAASLLFAADPPSPPHNPIPIGQNYGVVSGYTAGEVLNDPTDVIRSIDAVPVWNSQLYQFTGGIPHTCADTFVDDQTATGGAWVAYTNPPLAAITQIIVQKQSAGIGSLGSKNCMTNPYGVCCMSDHFAPIERCNRQGYPQCKCIACELKHNREKMREKDDSSNDRLQGIVEFILLIATGLLGMRTIS